MTEFRRTHDCGACRTELVGQTVRLSGWVHRYRDHGGVIFIDLRDRFGITQLVFDPKRNPQSHHIAEAVRAEWVITVEGNVASRQEGMVNSKLPTGAVDRTPAATVSP